MEQKQFSSPFKKNILRVLISVFLAIISPIIVQAADAHKKSNGTKPVYYQQTYDVCYAGCAAWNLYWNNNAFWNYIQSHCTMTGADMAKSLVKFAFNTVRGSADFGVLGQALWCTAMIKETIQPLLDKCAQDCQIDKWTYAADLSVATKLGSSGPGIVYYPAKSEDPTHLQKDKLAIFVHNSGWIYVPTFRVDVYQAQTRDPSCKIEDSDWELLDSYEIEELAPAAAKRALPTSDTQSLPGENIHQILWSAPKDKCVKIKAIVDPDNRIPELDEANGRASNNEAIITINKLSRPPAYQIISGSYHLLGNNLDDIKLEITVRNNGEEVGRPDIEVHDCYGQKTLRAAIHKVQIEPNFPETIDFEIKDLFWPNHPKYSTIKELCIEVKDEQSVASGAINVTIFSAEICGTIKDARGLPVSGVIVTLKEENGKSYTTRTDENGEYHLSGITEYGSFTISALDPTSGNKAEKQISFTLNDLRNTTENYCRLCGVNMVLSVNTASLRIICPDKDYYFYLNGKYFSYAGTGRQTPDIVSNIIPGSYRLIISRPGGAQIENLTIGPGEEKMINCRQSSLKIYTNDDGINFSPTLNHLWNFKLPTGYILKTALISPDGSTVFLAIANPQRGLVSSTGKQDRKHHSSSAYQLLIFDQTGKITGRTNLPDKLPVVKIHLDSAYDGHLVLVDDNLLIDRHGRIVARRPLNTAASDRGTGTGILSWDGSLICNSSGLYDSSFVPLYTGIWSPQLDQKHTLCRFDQWAVFAFDTTVLSKCKDGDNLCWIDFFSGRQIPLINGDVFQTWSRAFTPDKNKILVTGSNIANHWKKELRYLDNGLVKWHMPVSTENCRLSLSPQGNYAVVLEPSGQDFSLKIFDKFGNNLLDGNPDENWKWEQDFYDAKATGNGIFYVYYDGIVHFGVLGVAGKARKQELSVATSNN